jgi:hypothetical protein
MLIVNVYPDSVFVSTALEQFLMKCNTSYALPHGSISMMKERLRRIFWQPFVGSMCVLDEIVSRIV